MDKTIEPSNKSLFYGIIFYKVSSVWGYFGLFKSNVYFFPRLKTYKCETNFKEEDYVIL